MEASNLKNMVVLKNLPSNIVDEAIIVLKTNKKAKKLQKIEKNNQLDKEEKKVIINIVKLYISKGVFPVLYKIADGYKKTIE